ncbi:MAG: hypothetical protein ACI9P5_004281 [Saprospiraceae bacterium]|jgi:hypothetical protein|tara:strand:+ start:780 stop:1523 length:744 start_codon:yes stop_codon:yes gene_type:complete
MSELQTKIRSQFENYYSIGVAVFLLFFVVEGINIHSLRLENEQMLENIDEYTQKIDDGNDEILAYILQSEKFMRRSKANNDKARPFIHLFETYDPKEGVLSEFVKQVSKDCLNKSISGFGSDAFKDVMPIISLSNQYSQLQEYALARARQEFMLRLNSGSGLSICCWFNQKVFTIKETVGDKYHFYPNNFQTVSCNSYIRINGEIISDEEYFWRPTTKGIHYFNIEYIDFLGLEVHRKTFRVGLKVV